MSHLPMKLASAVVMLLTSVGLTLPVEAAAPNDNFVNATIVTVPGKIIGDNYGATMEPGEPDSQQNFRSVWWRFSPAVTGRYVIATRLIGFDTFLGI